MNHGNRELKTKTLTSHSERLAHTMRQEKKGGVLQTAFKKVGKFIFHGELFLRYCATMQQASTQSKLHTSANN